MLMMKKIKKTLTGKRRQKSNYVMIFPHLISFASATLGFFSLTASLEGKSMVAAYAILCAALLDACDGRIARALGSETLFGKELDALVDAISFCLAPAMLLYSMLAPYTAPWFSFFTGVFFVCAGLFRLARFNSRNDTQEVFIGLPTTAAGMYFANLVLWVCQRAPVLSLGARTMLWSAALILAVLMVSPCAFPAFKQRHLPLACKELKLGALSIFLVLCCLKEYGILLLCQSFYIIGALVYASCGYAKRSKIVKFYR